MRHRIADASALSMPDFAVEWPEPKAGIVDADLPLDPQILLLLARANAPILLGPTQLFYIDRRMSLQGWQTAVQLSVHFRAAAGTASIPQLAETIWRRVSHLVLATRADCSPVALFESDSPVSGERQELAHCEQRRTCSSVAGHHFDSPARLEQLDASFDRAILTPFVPEVTLSLIPR